MCGVIKQKVGKGEKGENWLVEWRKKGNGMDGRMFQSRY
jgi:hypothetical protein